MKFIYSLALLLYQTGVRLAAISGNKKAKLWLEGRKNLFSILSTLQPKKSLRYWVHCSSLGEFEQGRPLIEEIKKRNPDIEIILTFFSPSGYEIRKNYPLAQHVLYLPLDSARNATRFIGTIQPDLVFFIKYEYWYHYLALLNKKRIPVYFVSSIFRPSQIFFKWYGRFFRNMLKMVTHFFVQDDTSKELLQQAGINECTVTGDTRFDRVAGFLSNAKRIPQLESFSKGHQIFIAGSTWPEDETLIIPELHNLITNGFRVIFFPHEVNTDSIHRLENDIRKVHPNLKTVLFSSASENDLKVADLLLVDTIGLLSSAYAYANVAYIGGGFGKGIHNILEAATYGIPVLFGPRFEKFREAKELVRQQGAFPVQNIREFSDVISTLILNPSKSEAAGKIAKEYVQNQTGSTAKILNYLDGKNK
ncbi:MAG: polysaccharide pyruvyl transferase family protein [Bacteroidetes bacterium]|nr:polysaccharide pyruvyl transferase family protein [Bacteroidota bacterium]